MRSCSGAAIAIPAYNDYIARAQAAEGVELLAGGKTPMSEFFADRGRWPAAVASVMGTTAGKYVNGITITTGSATTGSLVLTADFKASGVNSNLTSKTTILTTTDNGQTWSCIGGTVDAKFLPGACRP